MKLLKRVYTFFLRPKYQEYQYPKSLRRKLFFNILGLKLLLGFMAALLMTMVHQIVDANLGQHAIDKMLEDYSLPMIFFLAVVLAPFIEELIFRAPLGLFRTSRYFPLAFYLSVIAFGFVHLFNFEGYKDYLWLAPFLVLPQLISGVFLGFIRVRMGLVYSIALHAAFNCILIAPFLLVQLLKTLQH